MSDPTQSPAGPNEPTRVVGPVPPETMASAPPPPEKIGPFTILEVLGQGGFGIVYRGRDHELERDVAIKVLSTGSDVDKDTLDRFRREARSLASVTHPNITGIYQTGSDERGEFFVMELVEGTSLDRKLQQGPLEIDETVRVLQQAVKGLKAAYAKGIVHRDIKPANILITRMGEVKLTDFGLAKPIDGGSDLTAPQVIVGSPHYMSPEQARGQELDHRSDMYSLGVTLYHMITGKPPFTGNSAVEILSKHLRESPPPIKAAPSELPQALRTLLESMLAKSKQDRPVDYDAILKELEEILLLVTSGILPRKASKMVTAIREDTSSMRLVLGGVLVLGALAAFMLSSMMAPRPPSGEVAAGGPAPVEESAARDPAAPEYLWKAYPPAGLGREGLEPDVFEVKWRKPLKADEVDRALRSLSGVGIGVEPAGGSRWRYPLKVTTTEYSGVDFWWVRDGWERTADGVRASGAPGSLPLVVDVPTYGDGALEVHYRGAGPKGSIDVELVTTPLEENGDAPHLAYRAKLRFTDPDTPGGTGGLLELFVTDVTQSRAKVPALEHCGDTHLEYDWSSSPWRLIGFSRKVGPAAEGTLSIALAGKTLKATAGAATLEVELNSLYVPVEEVLVWPRVHTRGRAELLIDKAAVTGEPCFTRRPCRSGMGPPKWIKASS